MRCITVISRAQQASFQQTDQEKHKTPLQKTVLHAIYCTTDRVLPLVQSCIDDQTDSQQLNLKQARNSRAIPSDFPIQSFSERGSLDNFSISWKARTSAISALILPAAMRFSMTAHH